MSKLDINGIKYMIHYRYNLYGSDNSGNIINIVRKIPMVGL